MEYRHCLFCNEPIEQMPYRKPRKFCSGKCRSAWWHQYHRKNYAAEGKRTAVCECCGKEFPILWESKEYSKYCSRDCYFTVRYHSHKLETISTTSKSSLDAYQAKLEKYRDHPYVESDPAKKCFFVNDAFFSAAKAFCDMPISDVLRIFEIDSTLVYDREKLKIHNKLKRTVRLQPAMPDIVPPESEISMRIMLNRIAALEKEINQMLQKLRSWAEKMEPVKKKEVCLMLDSLPKDPAGIYTKQYLFDSLGISRYSYYQYVNNARYGLSISSKDELDEEYVRAAFEYKGYPKGVRMVYMLIPRLSGRRIGLDRVRRIMRKYGMNCDLRSTSASKDSARAFAEEQRKPNLLQRMFRLHRPNQVRLTDVTEIKCNDQLKAYGSALTDPVTGLLVAFNVSVNNDLNLAMTTLRNADKYPCTMGGILHSDRGALYTSLEFQAEVKAMGLTQSMSRRGNCWDNAPQESFFGHFKDECRQKYKSCETIDDLRKVIEDYAYYYNHERGLWERNHMTPVEYEAYLLSLSKEEYAAYLCEETKKYIHMKEEAKRKAIMRNREDL